MNKRNYQLVWKAAGDLDAQILKNYLDSFGIEVLLYEESIGKTFGFTSAPLGEVEVYVPNAQAEVAIEIISKLYDSKK